MRDFPRVALEFSIMSTDPSSNIDTIGESIDVLTDGVWDWRDVKASGALLMAIGSLILSGYALLYQPESPPAPSPEPSAVAVAE